MRRILTIIVLALFFCSCADGKVRQYKLQVVSEYPHDTGSYTQGLFFDGGSLYESTGQYGSSTFRIVDLASGKALRKLDFGKKYFVEGSVMLGGELFILTWTNKVLTTDGRQLIASDGSSRLYFMDNKFQVKKTLNVRLDGRAVNNLNELEYIDGKIWANVYVSDVILIINPENGQVEATVDCTGLLPRSLRTVDTDVLNGIAVNPEDGKIYLTGKNWPRLYEVRLVEKK